MSAPGSNKCARLDPLAEEFADRYRRGERPSMQEYLDQYPDLAEDIRETAGKWCTQTFAWMAKYGAEEELWQLAAECLSKYLDVEPEPDMAEARVGRARAFLVLKLPDKAIAEANRAVEMQPRSLLARLARGEIYLGQKKWDAALGDYNVVVEIQPDDAGSLEIRADLLARGGQWTQAAADFKKLTMMSLQATRPWYLAYRHALALLAAGKTGEYRQACTSILEQLKDTDEPEGAFFTAWTCALAPEAGTDFTLPIQLAEKALSSNAELVKYHQGRRDFLPHGTIPGGPEAAPGGRGEGQSRESFLVRVRLVLPSHDPLSAGPKGRSGQMARKGEHPNRAGVARIRPGSPGLFVDPQAHLAIAANGRGEAAAGAPKTEPRGPKPNPEAQKENRSSFGIRAEKQTSFVCAREAFLPASP
jgi:tetratricopeptide (TPR) repeat protein